MNNGFISQPNSTKLFITWFNRCHQDLPIDLMILILVKGSLNYKFQRRTNPDIGLKQFEKPFIFTDISKDDDCLKAVTNT